MGLSQHIKVIIEDYRRRLCKEVPMSTDMIIDLRNEHIIAEEEEYKLERYQTDKQRVHEFLKILDGRGNDDFIKFCKILMEYQANAVKDLGKELLDKVSQESDQSNNGMI